MSKRRALADAACTTACVDADQHRASKGVLCSIENIVHSPKRMADGLKSPTTKKQRCLELDQGAREVKRLDVSCLFAQARSVLRQPPSNAVQAPIGRVQQTQVLSSAVQDFVASGAGISLYVSGLPGTGKSHTVRKVLQQLVSDSPDAAIITWINCMSVTTAGQVYSQIASSATGQSNFQSLDTHLDSPELSSESDLDSTCHAQLDLDLPAAGSSSHGQASATYKQLVGKLSKPHGSTSWTPQTANRTVRKSYRATRSSSSSSQDSELTAPSNDSSPMATPVKTPSRSRKTKQSSSTKHIIVLDEIDNLVKKSQADLVQLFLLPHEPSVQVMVIGIANSIDLTERMLPELKLKMCSPQLICFPAYTTKQLADILNTCLQELPCKLFEPSAVDLCSRSVGTSSGDLRHALKACRAAVDELERQQQQVDTGTAAAASAGPPTVTVRYMMGALSRLASVRSSQFGAQATSSIRTLPNQQQLLLYSLSVLCRPRDAAGDDTKGSDRKKGTSQLWAAAGTASALDSSNQLFVLAVGLEEAFTQYKQVCKLLSLPPCSRTELQHMAELLVQMALVDVVRPAASSGGSAARSLKGLGGRGKGLGGLGGGKGLGKVGSIGCAQQQEIKLCLKASVAEVEAALKHNPALRCLVDK